MPGWRGTRCFHQSRFIFPWNARNLHFWWIKWKTGLTKCKPKLCYMCQNIPQQIECDCSSCFVFQCLISVSLYSLPQTWADILQTSSRSLVQSMINSTGAHSFVSNKPSFAAKCYFIKCFLWNVPTALCSSHQKIIPLWIWNLSFVSIWGRGNKVIDVPHADTGKVRSESEISSQPPVPVFAPVSGDIARCQGRRAASCNQEA